MEATQRASNRLADRTAARVAALWQRHLDGTLTTRRFQALAAAVIVEANAAGVGLADIGLAAEVTRQLRRPTGPLGLTPTAVQVDPRRVAADIARIIENTPADASTVEEIATSRQARLGQLARSEPLLTVATVVQAGMRRRGASGWTRQLSGQSCPLCVGWADGAVRPTTVRMARHVGCVVAGTNVAGPSTLAATRRRYRGQLVTIRTATGNLLSLTVNHPVLTNRGWVPAGLLREGDDVVSGTFAKGTLLDGPHEQQVPSRIEQVAASLSVVLPVAMPGSSEDFHGDGTDGQVDVVWADRLLRDDLDPVSNERGEGPLVVGDVTAVPAHPFVGQGSRRLLAHRGRAALRRCVCGRQLRHDLLGAHPLHRQPVGLPRWPDRDRAVYQALPNDEAAHAVGAGQRQLALAGQVAAGDLVPRNGHAFAPGATRPRRFDPPPSQVTAHDIRVAAERGRHLLHRLAGLVQLDRVVDVSIADLWSGQVHNLMTVEGWYEANGLIVSNCDCLQSPVFT